MIMLSVDRQYDGLCHCGQKLWFVHCMYVTVARTQLRSKSRFCKRSSSLQYQEVYVAWSEDTIVPRMAVDSVSSFWCPNRAYISTVSDPFEPHEIKSDAVLETLLLLKKSVPCVHPKFMECFLSSVHPENGSRWRGSARKIHSCGKDGLAVYPVFGTTIGPRGAV